jgi:adenylate cyclase
LRKAQIKRTDNLNAWDHYLRGMALLTEQTCAANAEARAQFRKSIDLDSTYGEAWAGLSYSHLRDFELKCTENPKQSLDLGYTTAQESVKLAERSAFTHYVLSTAYVWREQIALSLKELDRTLELNPYFARAHLARGNRLDLAGQSAEGIAALRRALELNPRDPERHTYLSFLSRALIINDQIEEALQLSEHAALIAPHNPDLQYRLAVCLAHLDRVEDARAALARSEELRPGFVAMRNSWRPYNDDQRNAVFFAGMERHGLRSQS